MYDPWEVSDDPHMRTPAYGQAALSDLLPSIAEALGVAGAAGPLPLAPAERVCVFLVDGLGACLIREHAAIAPYLASLLAERAPDADPPAREPYDDGGAGDGLSPAFHPYATGPSAAVDAPPGTGRLLSAGFPSTTATSLTSLGTGLPPGAHGMLGLRVALPGSDRLLNLLRWDASVDPYTWQPHDTVLQRAAADGVAVTHVSAPRFVESGLTRSSLRGGTYVGAESMEVRVAEALAALGRPGRALVYLYYAGLDVAGHVAGVDSEAWRGQLRLVDEVVADLARGLPAGTVLYVTADHGMVDVPRHRHIDIDQDPELRAGLALFGGEGRARHLYAHPGAARDVLAIWQDRLADVALVRSRAQAIADGWFGPGVDEAVLPRIGDVVVALREDWAVVASRRESVDTRQVGMHGSLTRREQQVPLLEIRG